MKHIHLRNLWSTELKYFLLLPTISYAKGKDRWYIGIGWFSLFLSYEKELE